MAILEDIAGRLVSNGIGTITAPTPTIFIGQIPSSPDVCVVLEKTGSRAPEHTFGPVCSAPAVEYHGFRVIARATSHASAEALARSVFDLLHNYSGTLGSTRILHLLADQMPFPTGHDENARTRVFCNYTARVAP